MKILKPKDRQHVVLMTQTEAETICEALSLLIFVQEHDDDNDEIGVETVEHCMYLGTQITKAFNITGYADE